MRLLFPIQCIFIFCLYATHTRFCWVARNRFWVFECVCVEFPVYPIYDLWSNIEHALGLFLTNKEKRLMTWTIGLEGLTSPRLKSRSAGWKINDNDHIVHPSGKYSAWDQPPGFFFQSRALAVCWTYVLVRRTFFENKSEQHNGFKLVIVYL